MIIGRSDAYRYSEASIERAMSVAALPEVAEVFGEGLARNIAELTFIPNLRGNVITIPRKYVDTDAIPVIGVQPGQEVAHAENWGQTPTQIRNTGKVIESWGGSVKAGQGEDAALALVNGFLRHIDDGLDRKHIAREGAAATVIAPRALIFVGGAASLAANPTRAFMRRPMMLLVQDPDVKLTSPLLFLHEWKHRRQLLDKPVSKIDADSLDQTRLRNELEAYHVQAVLLSILRGLGYKPAVGESLTDRFEKVEEGRWLLVRETFIDRKRVETNQSRNDKFFPNGTLMNILKEVGLDV